MAMELLRLLVRGHGPADPGAEEQHPPGGQ
jgi:hypothetical protein